MNSVERWDMLMNFCGLNDSALCHVPKGTMLAVLKNLHLVVGIVNLIIKVLGIVAVVQVALMGQQENISLGRSVETLLQCTIPFSEIQGKCNAVFYLYYIFQLPLTYPSAEEDLASHEDSVPSAMTTRLRRQSERERERELRDVRMRKMPENSDLLPVAQTEPSIWTVDDVWAFIHSLPGCQDIADEFRAQEIDGQALLLLKEDHLMSAMNIKLGPALKICARINSLKES